MTADLLPTGLAVRHLSEPLKISSESVAKASRILDQEGKVDENTKLLPPQVAADVIRVWNAELEIKPSPAQVDALVRRLLAGFPDLNPHDQKGYLKVLTNAFAAFPFYVSAKVCEDMCTGRTFHPRGPEVILALEAEKKRILSIVGLAMQQRVEREKREKLAAEEAAYQKSPEAKARAKAAAEALLSALKPMEP